MTYVLKSRFDHKYWMPGGILEPSSQKGAARFASAREAREMAVGFRYYPVRLVPKKKPVEPSVEPSDLEMVETMVFLLLDTKIRSALNLWNAMSANQRASVGRLMSAVGGNTWTATATIHNLSGM